MFTHSQNVTSMSAHREWAKRPSDERYQSVEALHAAAVAQAERSKEQMVSLANLQVVPLEAEHDLVLEVPTLGRHDLTHWSFGQLASMAGATRGTYLLRKLPARITADALNHLFQKCSAEQVAKLYVDESARVARAFTAEGYGRVRNADVAQGVLDLMAENPGLHLPLAYSKGECGEPMVPSGAYLGDRDLFIIIVDENRSIDDPTDTSHEGMFRGLILRNSEVGASSLLWDVFYYRMICGNHIIWGFKHIAGMRRRHVGKIEKEWQKLVKGATVELNRDTTFDRELLRRAQQMRLVGSSTLLSRDAQRKEIIETVSAWSQRAVTAATIGAAYDYAEQNEPDPTTVWGMVQGMTAMSQRTAYQDLRYALDRAAAMLLRRVPVES